jgi:Zn-dependent peptidase ImmA (M78 family)/DNA-binding XRE family transcriptional regulator
MAREVLGYTQDELARSVDLGRDAIIDIEKGTRKVKVDEMMALGRALMRDMRYFLAEEPDRQLAVISYRGDASAATKEAELWLRLRLADYVQVRSALSLSPPELGIASKDPEGHAQEEGYRAAARVRQAFDFGDRPIEDFRELLEEFESIAVFGREVDDPEFCGMLLFDLESGVAAMLVQERMRSSRRRFTLAHEYGHYIWKKSQNDLSPDVLFGDDKKDRPEEVFCICFAAGLLIPAEGVTNFFAGKPKGCNAERVMELADCFGVSFQAASYRLQNMGLMNPTDAERLREETRPTTLRGFRGEYDPFAPESPLLRQLVAEAYYEGLLSEGRCAEIVEMTTLDFVESIEEAETDGFAAAEQASCG